MKRRRNEIVAIQARLDPEGEEIGEEFLRTMSVVLAGGQNAEPNRVAVIENMERINGGKWSARIVYRWRSHQHLKQWLDRGEKFGGRGKRDSRRF